MKYLYHGVKLISRIHPKIHAYQTRLSGIIQALKMQMETLYTIRIGTTKEIMYIKKYIRL